MTGDFCAHTHKAYCFGDTTCSSGKWTMKDPQWLIHCLFHPSWPTICSHPAVSRHLCFQWLWHLWADFIPHDHLPVLSNVNVGGSRYGEIKLQSEDSHTQGANAQKTFYPPGKSHVLGLPQSLGLPYFTMSHRTPGYALSAPSITVYQ